MKLKASLKAIFLLTVLFLYSSFIFQETKEGIFKTYEDYQNGKVTDVGKYKSLAHAGSDFTLTFEKGQEKVKYKLDEKPFWGFRNNDGEDFRVAPVIKSEKNFYPYRIVSSGKISLYGSYNALVTNEKGHVYLYAKGTPSFLSNGADGQIYYFSFKELKKALADDPILLEKFNKQNAYYVDVIIEYNKKHKN
jgi:hypothetical protein